MINFYNSLSKKIEAFNPQDSQRATIYSCGPTVYDHVHIGNLSSFIYADILRRVIETEFEVKQVMNFTDVDDKTIARSKQLYPDLDPDKALKKLTSECSQLFLTEMEQVGNDIKALTFVNATDEATITGMKKLVTELVENKFAYLADDGIYFSIEAYRQSGKRYGQLSKLNNSDTSSARIDNDEYDKNSVHDFALWKKQKPGEPAWEFAINSQDMTGRPGWHIECSVMSADALGQPFDIHTGGIDLIFPHHENEIAQSTAGKENPIFARYFIHNEHILVDGKKMSKSLHNFYTLTDIITKGYDPLAFRLLVLQAHYRSQAHFSWDNLEAAQNRLKRWRNIAELRWQLPPVSSGMPHTKLSAQEMTESLKQDLNTPETLKIIDTTFDTVDPSTLNNKNLVEVLEVIDSCLGLQLLIATPDITQEQKALMIERDKTRKQQDWSESDRLREELEQQGIMVRDSDEISTWYR